MEKTAEQPQQMIIPDFIVSAMGRQAIQIEVMQARIVELERQLKEKQAAIKTTE